MKKCWTENERGRRDCHEEKERDRKRERERERERERGRDPYLTVFGFEVERIVSG